MNNKSNFRRGSVELLILHLLSQQDYYGYEISTLIREQLETIFVNEINNVNAATNGYYVEKYKQIHELEKNI